jgi:predicted ATPase with chaperone activity
MMRQPLEDGQLTISRAAASLTYPVRRPLVGTVERNAELQLLPSASGRDERALDSCAVTETRARVVINYGKPTVERSHGSVKGQWTRL